MIIKQITEHDRESYNKLVHHPLQSYEWGEFREKTGIKVIRHGLFENEKVKNVFQLTLHPIPHTPYTIGYLPKGEWPSGEVLEELRKIGKREKCIFIQLEPNEVENGKSFDGAQEGKNGELVEPLKIENLTFNSQLSTYNLKPAAHPLFTKYTFILDLTKSEEELLKAMHPKTRYNIKVAQRHGVLVKEDNTPEAFERYWQLTEETTKRQKFYAHTKKYHELQWQTFPHSKMENGPPAGGWKMENQLTSHLFTASYQGMILTTMLFFVFHDTLYYPYGASSNEYRNVMHSTLTMWEAIRWGKKIGLKKFDMWGALSQDPDPDDPWMGFHTFKERFGPEHIEFAGSFDLIINPFLYRLYVIADKLRWIYLKIRK